MRTPVDASWPARPPASSTGPTSATRIPSWPSTSFRLPVSGPRMPPSTGGVPGAWWIPSASMVTGVPATVAPSTRVPPVSSVFTPSEVAFRSVTSESIFTRPRRSNPLTWLRAVTVTVEPSVSVVAIADCEATVATAGASRTGIVARANDPSAVAVTRALSPGPGFDSAAGEPVPDAALTRYGYSGMPPG